MGTSRNRGPKAPQTDDSAFQEFEVAARLEVPLPADAHVVGEPVTVTEICYTGHPRIGLLATCLGKRHEAADVFRKMLWLNPGDNPGARFNLASVEAGETWDEMEGDER